jgi:hypothetical protein
VETVSVCVMHSIEERAWDVQSLLSLFSHAGTPLSFRMEGKPAIPGRQTHCMVAIYLNNYC